MNNSLLSSSVINFAFIKYLKYIFSKLVNIFSKSKIYLNIQNKDFAKSLIFRFSLFFLIFNLNSLNISAQSMSGVNPAFYNEGAAPVILYPGFSFSGGSNYGGGYMLFDITNGDAKDQLAIFNDPNPNLLNAISVVGNGVYIGTGSGTSIIGSIDPIMNGQNGQDLKINFTSNFQNAGFESGLVGWNAVDQRVDLGVTSILGFTTPNDPTNPGNTTNADNNNPSGASYNHSIDNTYFSQGSQSLRLYSNMTTAVGCDVVHGPYAYSSSFSANSGDVLTFDWSAINGADWYDVFGYLLDLNTGTSTIILNQWGASTPWTPASVTVPANSTYAFVFVSGTYDATCGRAAGASLYIDNFVVANNLINPSIIQLLGQHVTYENTCGTSDATRNITVSVVNASSVTTTASSTIAIATLNPVITCPTNISVNSPANQCAASATFSATATDNCLVGITYSMPSGSTFPVGTTTVTATATDTYGNIDVCTFNVIVQDVTTPVFVSCPTSYTVDVFTNDCVTSVFWAVPNATDNCGIVTVTQTSGIAQGSIQAPGVYPVSYVATDNATPPNTSLTCSFNINVVDTENPVIINCPYSAQEISVDANCQAVLPNYAATMQATDNCGYTWSQIPVAGGTYTAGLVVTVSVTATDVAGNFSTCSFNVNVIDEIDPVITCPANITDSNDPGLCGAVATYNLPTITDNCITCTAPTSLPNFTFVGVLLGHTYFRSNYSDTWTNGQAFAVSQGAHLATITSAPENTLVVGNGAQAWIGLTDQVTEGVWQWVTGEPLVYTAWAPGEPNNLGNEDYAITNWSSPGNWNDLPNQSHPFIIEFDCAAAVPTQTAGLPSGSTFPVGTTTNTFTYTDVGGNTAECSFDVIITDTQLPVLSCAGLSATRTTSSGGTGECYGEYAWNHPIPTDNCGIVDYHFTFTNPDGTIDGPFDAIQIANGNIPAATNHNFVIGITTVTYYVEDIHGNTNSCSFTVTVTDNEVPVFENCPPAGFTVDVFTNDCITDIMWNLPTATDNCSVTVTQTGGPLYGSQQGPGNYTITYTASDNATPSNTATCSFAIEIADTENPIIQNCPYNNQEIFVDADCEALLPNYTTTINAFDNCGTYTTTQFPLTGAGPYATGDVVPVTITVTDGIGNSSTCSFDVDVLDDIDPVINCPLDITIVNDPGICGALVTFADPVISDNCTLPMGTVGPLNFTTAGAAGRFGPTQAQINAAYLGSDLEGLVTVNTQGIQEWIVPVSGTYSINVTGASGGNGYEGVSQDGGKGVNLYGEFNLTAGQLVKIIVGQQGETGYGGGGGGGSFVWIDGAPLPLIVAGGGGGAGDDDQGGNPDGVNASYTNSGTATPNGLGGIANGGNGGSSAGAGGGGGGWLTDGANGFNGTERGRSIPNGAIGGDSFNGTTEDGGFGCGGSNYGYAEGGGGGGGYSGGAGGDFNIDDGGGGGGSFNSGSNPVNGPLNSGNGLVVIELIGGGASALAQTAGLPSGSIFPVGTTTNTYVVTDASGNTATCSFNVTVTDNQDPQILCSGNVAITTSQLTINGYGESGDCSGTYEWAVPLPTDNCGLSNYTVTYTNPDGTIDGPYNAFVFTPENPANGTPNAIRNFDLGTTTITYYIEDVAGNTNSCSFTVSVTDNEAPQFVVCPPAGYDLDVFTNDCVTDIFWVIPIAEDNCSVNVVQTQGPAYGSTVGPGSYFIEYIATDEAGLKDTCSFMINVVDTENPVIINCPYNDLEIYVDGNCEAVLPNYAITMQATDNCGYTWSQTPIAGSVYTAGDVVVVTVTATDASGNATSCTFNVNVIDFIPPTIECPADISVANDVGKCGAVVTFTDPVISDNCPLVFTTSGSVNFAYTSGIQTFIVPSGVTSIEVTANGAQGGLGGGLGARMVGTFAVTQGEILSVLVGGAGTEYSNGNGGGGGGSFVWKNIGNELLVAAAGGGGTSNNSNSSIGGPGSATISPTNSINGSGNAAGGTGGNGGIGGDGANVGALYPAGGGGGAGWNSNGTTGLYAYGASGGTYPLAGGAGGVGFNPCGNVNIVGGYGGGGGGGGCSGASGGGGGYNGGGGGNCWNGSTWGSGGGGGSFNGGTNPANLAGANSGNGSVSITYNVLDMANLQQIEGLPSGSTFPVGTTTNTFVITDNFGNTAECSFDVTVTDEEDPAINCPGNVSITSSQLTINGLGESGDCSGTYEWPIPVPTDNCGLINYSVTYTNPDGTIDGPYNAFVYSPDNFSNTSGGVPIASRNFNLGISTVTYYVEDEAGNTNTCSFTVTVTDDEDPYWTIDPQNLTIECDLDNPGFVNSQIQSWLGSIGGGNAGDNCIGITYSNNYNAVTFSDGCGATGFATVTFTATDASGNTTTRTATITIVDTEIPIITLPAVNMTVECDGAGNVQALSSWLVSNGGAQAQDNCSPVTWLAPVLLNTIIGCGNSAEYIYQFQAMDECNNLSAITIASFFIEDTEAPYWTVYPQDATAECGVANTAISEWLANFGGGEVADNCGGASGSITMAYWNEAEFLANVEGVVSMESFEGLPLYFTSTNFVLPDFTVNTSSQFTVDNSFVSDGTKSLAPTSTGNFTMTFTFPNAINTFGLNILDFGTWGNNTMTFMNDLGESFTIAISNGNLPSGNNIFFGVVNSAMAFNQVIITSVDGGDYIAFDEVYYGLGPLTGNFVYETNLINYTQGCGNTGVYEFLFKANDLCNNDTSWVATFTVTDLTPPVIVAPGNLTISCLPNQQSNLTQILDWLDNFTASDTCGTVTVTNDFEVGLIDFCTGEDITVTWTAIDECGNTNTATSILIVEQDQTGPTWDIAPQNLTIECGPNAQETVDAWVAAFGNGLASDACTSQVSYSILNAISGTGCGGTYFGTYTFVATDGCGNATPYAASFSVVDTQAPVITSPAQDMTVECDGQGNTAELNSWLANHGGAQAQDICSPVTWLPPVLLNTIQGCGNSAEYVYQFQSTDACNNLSTITIASFTIEDTEAPYWTAYPQDATAECGVANTAISEWLANFGGGEVADVCGGAAAATTYYTDEESFLIASGNPNMESFESLPITGTYVNTLTLTDFVMTNNTDMRVWNIPVSGRYATEGVNYVGISGQSLLPSTTIFTFNNPINSFGLNITDWGDSGIGELIFSNNAGDIFQVAVTPMGNGNHQFFGVLNSAVNFTTVTFNCTATDAFGLDEIYYGNVQFQDGLILETDLINYTPGCGNTGVYEFLFKANDLCNNDTSWVATFTVTDLTPPVIVAPGNLTISCLPNQQSNLTQILDWLDNFTASDTCGTVTVTNDFEVGLIDFCTGEDITVTWTAIDECGNTNTATSILIVEQDQTGPTWDIAPQNLTIECGPNAQETVDAWVTAFGNGIASDACTSQVSYSILNAISGTGCGGTYFGTYTFVATDGCGNATPYAASFSVVDTQAPVITSPAQDITVECDGQGNTAELTNWLNNHGGAIATDACSNFTWNFTLLSTTQHCGGTSERRYSFVATDACGNASVNTEATFTILDTIVPQITTQASELVVDCDGLGNVTQRNTWLNNHGGAVAADICSGPLSWTYDIIVAEDSCGITGRWTYRFTVTDQCGNKSYTTADFVIRDITPPAIITPAQPLVVECDGTNNATEILDWLNNHAGATATDACGTITWTNDYGTILAGCGTTGSVLVTFTATDECNNSSSTSATFTINDTTDPIWEILPHNLTIECDGSTDPYQQIISWLNNVGGAEAEDDCSYLIYSNNYTGLLNGCSAGTGSAVVTFRATDACGNFVTADATVSVVDNGLPVIITPARDTTVECDGLGNTVALNTWLNNHGGAVASDLCSEPLTWAYTLINTIENCGGTSTRRYAFRATDACGNVSVNTEAKFRTIDTTIPQFIVLPQDSIVQCDGQGNTAQLQAWLTDHAGLEATDICSNISSINYDLVRHDEQCGKTATWLYRFTISDACDNINTAEATFKVVDTIPPVITGGADKIMEECIDPPAGNYPEFDFWLTNNAGATAVDECDCIVKWTNNFKPENWVFLCGNTRYVDVTFYATDCCGNVDSLTHRFGIGDVTPPEFTNCPRPDIVVDVPTNLCESYVNFSMPYAIDNCSRVIIEQTDTTGLTSGDLFPVGCTILEFTATDSCGNQTICHLRIIVNDNHTPPVIECPANITMINDPGICGAIIDSIGLKVTDNCPGNVSVTYEVYDGNGNLVSNGLEDASGTEFPVGNNTVVYTAYDQPRFMITEIVQDGIITGVEIGNFGPAAIDLGCLEVSRENSPANETYTIPHGNILTAGSVFTRSFTNLAVGTPASYTLRMKDRLIDSVRINAGLDGVDIFRISPIDTDTNYDFEVVNACQAGSYGLWNPQLPHYTDNGTMTKMQSVNANRSACEFKVKISDVESPVCATTDTISFSTGNFAITPGTCISSVFTLPAGKIADINITNLNATVTNAGKVTVTLTSPWGKQITLLENICNNTANINVKLDDIAASLVSSAGCSPLGNGIEYKPLQPFNTYFGENSLGNWKLELYSGSPNSGTLNNWAIEFILVTDFDQDDILVDNDPGECGAEVTWTHPYLLDNCIGGSMTVSYSFSNNITGESSEVTEILLSSNGTIDLDGTVITRYFEVGVTEITYTLTDIYGNTSVCGFTVTVEDNEAPIFPQGCQDMTIYLDPGDCYGAMNIFPQVTDNCEVDTLQYYYSNGTVADLIYIPIGDHTILAVATDIYGNKDTCTFIVHILEYIPTNLALGCNENINISLDADCKAELNADMILEGNNYRCYEKYCITVVGPDGLPHGTTFGYEDVGKTFMVTICDCLGSGNCCMGQVTIMEKFEPELECPADTAISCNANTHPDELGYVKILNCEPFAQISYSDDLVDNGSCGTPRATIFRTWTVDDQQGNVVNCVQEITIKRSSLDEVVFPADVLNLDCKIAKEDNKATLPENTGYPKVDGIPINFNTGLCMFSYLYTDEIYRYCGNSYEILRTWKVRDMCGPVTSLNPRIYVQVIRVFDTTPPQICSCEDYEVNADAYKCEGSVEIPAPCIIENCSEIKSIKLFVSGAAVKITGNYNAGTFKAKVYNMKPGKYSARWVIVDDCNNKTSCEFVITVSDKSAPIAICEQYKVVSLTTSGTASVHAEDFDSGSFDNCNPVWFKVLRVNAALEYDGGCIDLNGDDFPKTLSMDVWYDDEVYFCCEDLDTNVMVNMRVFDVDPGQGPVDPKRMLPGGDLYGHYNDCWSIVTTECKIPPLLVCKDVVVTCEESIDPYENTVLLPQVSGVCDYELTYSDARDNGVCSAKLIRTWTASGCNKTTQCKQNITITGDRAFDPCTIVFPADKQITCANDLPDGGKPTWDEFPCNIVTAEFKDDTFKFVDGACYKILRDWVVIDWCVYKENSGSENNTDIITSARKLNCNTLIKDGYYKYTQLLKVVDLIPPVISVEDKCFGTTDCYANNVELIAFASDSCNTNEEFWWKYKVEDLSCVCDPVQVSYNYLPKPDGAAVGKRSLDKLDKVSQAKLVMVNSLPVGQYKVTWTVGDGCGNATTKEQFFEIADRKAPTPVLVDLSSAVMSNGMVELTARSFDKGGCGEGCISSFDNCTDKNSLYFTFTPMLPALQSEPQKWTNQLAQYGENYFDPVTGAISTYAKYITGNAHAWMPLLNTSRKAWLCEYSIDEQDSVSVQIYVWDKFALNTDCDDNNFDFGITTLLLNHCGNSSISGIIKDINGDKFKGMVVNAKNLEESYLKMTDQDGAYSVFVSPDDYIITANSDENYLNGITTLDIVILQKHILSLKTITDPYKLLAADANASKTISTSDMLEIRKAILGVNAQFKNHSWLGINPDYVFQNPLFPAGEVDKASVRKAFVDKNQILTDQNFTAIKIGDLNNSANLIENRDDKKLSLIIDAEQISVNDKIEIPVYAKDFLNIHGMQFSLGFKDLKILDIKSGEMIINETNFNILKDKVLFSWDNSNGLSVEDGTKLFTIVAQSESNAFAIQSFLINDEGLRSEVYSGNDLRISGLQIELRSYGFSLDQNQPNPFTKNTEIDFVLPKTNQFEFSIFDVNGKEVYKKIGLGNKGKNFLTIDKSDLPLSGVYMYKLSSGDNTATKKLIFYR